MPVIRCPIADCEYATDDVEPAIAAALLVIHNNVHVSTTPAATTNNQQRAPKIERPRKSSGSSEDSLRNVMKLLAVIPVAVGVRRTELLATKQDHGENIRTFFTRIKGKAATCSYTVACSSGTCTQIIDFTDIMAKDVLIAGLVDEEIRREVLGWADLDTKKVNDTVTFIEAKEMARDAMNKLPVAAAVSAYKAKDRSNTKTKSKIPCARCGAEIEKFIWNQRQGRMIECSLCLQCWRKVTPRRGKAQREGNTNGILGTRKDETSALLIGAITHVPTGDSDTVARKRYKLYGVNVPHCNGTTDSNVNGQTVLSGHPVESAAVSAQMTHACEKMTPIVLDKTFLTHVMDGENLSPWRIPR